MNNAQEKYDELYNIISTLNVLIDEITDDYYKSTLMETKFEAEKEIEEVEEILRNEQREEYEQAILEYEGSVY